jgi:hypothetical protein
MLNRTAYLKMDMSFGGDDFSTTGDGEVLKDPLPMLKVRLFAHGCGMRGVQDLRELFTRTKEDILKFKEEMENNGLNSMSMLFEKYRVDKVLPSLDETLLAIADAFRKNRKISNNEVIGIFIHIDEHQIFYDAVKNYFKLDKLDALTYQKDLFYQLIQLKIDEFYFALKNKNFHHASIHWNQSCHIGRSCW